MRLGLSQCKAAHESAALRGLRRSLRSSSSSSSPSSSSASSRCIKLHLQAPQSLSTSSAPSSSSSSSLLCVKSHKRHRVKLASDAEKKSAPIVAIEAWKAPPPPPPPSLRRQRSLDLTSIRAPIPSRTLCRTSSCTTIGRKRVIGCFDDHEYSAASCFPSDLDEYLGDGRRRLEEKDEEEEDGEVEEEEDDDEDESPKKRFASLKLLSSCLDRSSSIVTSADLLSSPCTPASLGSIDATQSGDGDSLLEDLPFDILIRIVCCLEHDDLKPVSQVCKHLFQAVSSAWQTHFCFTTPRREKRGLMKFELFPEEPRMGAPSHRNRGAGTFVRPPTPQAPRQPPRPAEGRISDLSEACPFPHPSSSSSSSVNPLDSERMKPLSMPFHRVLFSEDELCQAVAENILS